MDSISGDKIIANLPGQRKLMFTTGKFDNFKVIIKSKDGSSIALRDEEYFETLKKLNIKYKKRKVYKDFIIIYDRTNKGIETQVLKLIDDIAGTYKKEDQDEVTVLYKFLYAAMIAEENKEHAPLGKRIKRLGIHMLLENGQMAVCASNFMRGMPAYKIAALCESYGF